jgi:WD40 repeat protein
VTINRLIYLKQFSKGTFLNGELIHTISWDNEEYLSKLISLDQTVYFAVGFISRFRLGKIQIMNCETGGEFGKLIGHSANVWALVQLEERHLASGSEDATVKIWQWTRAQLVHNLTGHQGCVYDLVAIRNFTILVSCSQDTTLKVWNRINGNVKTLNSHLGQIKKLLLLNNDQFASSLEDATVALWNLTEGKITRNLIGHSGRVQSLVNIDPSRVASGAKDWKIKIWQLNNTGADGLEKTLCGHSDEVFSLVLLANGHLVSCSKDETIRIWDLDKSPSLVKTTFDYAHGLALLNDGKMASFLKTVKIWHFESNSTIYTSNVLHRKLLLQYWYSALRWPECGDTRVVFFSGISSEFREFFKK